MKGANVKRRKVKATMKTNEERAFWVCASADGLRDCGYTHRTRDAADACRRRANAAIKRLHGPTSYSELTAQAGNDAARRSDDIDYEWAESDAR